MLVAPVLLARRFRAFANEEVPRNMPKIHEIQDSITPAEFKEVPEQFKSIYVEDNGRYVYKDPKALKDSMVNAKAEKTALAEKLAEYEGKYKDVDADEYRTLKGRAKEFEDLDKTNKGELDKIKGELREKYEGTISAKDKQILERDTRYANRILNGDVASVLAKAGARDKGVSLLTTQIKAAITTKMGDDGEPEFVVLDQKTKKPRLNDNADPFTIADLVAEAKKDYPELFGSQAGSGGGSGNTDGNTTAPTDEAPSTWNFNQKKAYISQHGDKAYHTLLEKESARKRAERADAGKRKSA